MLKCQIILAAIIFGGVVSFVDFAAFASEPSGKGRVIEFGWDTPTIPWLCDNAAITECTIAFDGIILDLAQRQGQAGLSWLAWAASPIPFDLQQKAEEDIELLNDANFIRLRENSFFRLNSSGWSSPPDWFDSDFNTVVSNITFMASAVNQTALAGIAFDPEDYFANCWHYPSRKYSATKTFEQYQVQVRQRGREVAAAIKTVCPGRDFTMLFLFANSLPYISTQWWGHPLSEDSYGLLPAFIDGLLDEAGGQIRVIDGIESAYPHKTLAEFQGSISNYQGGASLSAGPSRYLSCVGIGFGTWMDYRSNELGWYTDPNEFNLNHFTPETFNQAMDISTDLAELSWVYTQIPDWYLATVPEAYFNALADVTGLPPVTPCIELWAYLLRAKDPFPADAAQNVHPKVVLSWEAGIKAASHDVYFGTDINDVNDANSTCYTNVDYNNVDVNFYDPCGLEYYTTYYWRVDSINDANVWKGPIWSFRSQNVIVEPNLILWYEFDETDVNTAADSSGYERHGYVDVDGGDPNWDPNDGRYGGCLIFDDDTAVIVPNDVLSDINEGITITVWLRNAYREDDDNWVFDMGAGDFRVQVAVVTEPEREVLWRAGNDTNDVLTWDLDGIDPSWLIDWHPWVFVKDESAGTMSIYLHIPMFPQPWCLTASKTGVAETLVNVRNTPFKIGALTNHQNDFVGHMDDFRIYDRVLSEDEICPMPPDPCPWHPQPYNGQRNAPYNNDLIWKPGDFAASHDVYFGTNSDEVWDANRTNHPNVDYDNVTQTTYDPGLLEFGKTYYWRVDEVNEPNIWKCRLWRFTVADYITIDDFEDDANNQDLYADWYNGSVLYNGAQITLWVTPPVIDEHSMRYGYNNWFDWGDWHYYSETQTISLEPNDWDYYDIRVISLWFYGQAGNEATLYTQMNLGLEDNSNYGVVKYGDAGDEDMTDIQIEDWQNWEILTSRFANIDFNDVKKFCIGFGIRGNSILSFRSEELAAVDFSSNCIVDFADLKVMSDAWLQSGQNTADVYEDSIVNLKDFAVLANSWLEKELWPEL
ncbi:MAG: LamG-like jellyroll fold domain-containing protein [Planctomycetota bacterium]|jgi:hypothetical protein